MGEVILGDTQPLEMLLSTPERLEPVARELGIHDAHGLTLLSIILANIDKAALSGKRPAFAVPVDVLLASRGENETPVIRVLRLMHEHGYFNTVPARQLL